MGVWEGCRWKYTQFLVYSNFQVRSENSSPVEDKDEVDGSKMEMEDDVFEEDQRIAAESDQVDSAMVADVIIVEEAKVEKLFKAQEIVAPIVLTESIDAAFEAVIQSVSHADATLSMTQ